MQIRSTTAKFKARRKAKQMAHAYAAKTNLSDEALLAFEPIHRGIIAKAKREKKIPEKYLFFLATDADDILDELTAKDVIRYEFTEDGNRVYSHEVDQELVAHELGWHRS